MANETSTDTPEQAEFRQKVHAWLEANTEPKKAKSPWAVNFHTNDEDARREFESGRAMLKRLFDAGLTAFTYPQEYGGQGGPAWMESIFREEASQYEVNTGFVSATIAMLAPTLMRHANAEQKAHYLPRLLSGEYGFCQLFSEPGAGSDLAGLGCRAVRDGDEFVVNGQKVWNSAAQWCNWGMLLARTDPDVPKHQGITFLLVDMSTPGIEARPLVQATGAAHFNEVFLTDVRIPVANVVGEINGGWGPARTVLSNESAFIGSGNQGSLHEKIVMLAREFGKDSDPVIRQDIARFYTRERLLSIMGERILTAVRRRETPPIDPSILKLYVAQNKVLSGNLVTAMAGPAGIAGDTEQARWMQAELVGRYGISIGGGTNEVQKNNLSERALGLPREPRIDQTVPWKDVPK